MLGNIGKTVASRLSDESSTWLSRLLRMTWNVLAPALTVDRLLLAAKCAVAATVAWFLGGQLPGETGDYAYYAPLGALISMMPTLMGSLRLSLQTVAGLALGIGLAFVTIQFGASGWITVPISTGVGVLVGGLRGLGPGRDYVPIAALFVLVIGGANAEDFSIGYIAQMALGMGVGIAINLIVVPPLHTTQAAARVSSLRRMIADDLEAIGSVMHEKWPPGHTEWQRQGQAFRNSADSAEEALDDASESRRINPRSRWNHRDMATDYDDLTSLRRLSASTVDISDVLQTAIWGAQDERDVHASLPASVREPIGDCLTAFAVLIRAWDDKKDEEQAEKEALEALEALRTAARSVPDDDEGDSDAVDALVFTLRRMISLIMKRLPSHRDTEAAKIDAETAAAHAEAAAEERAGDDEARSTADVAQDAIDRAVAEAEAESEESLKSEAKSKKRHPSKG
jgi:uncharacterized membrane protein YgaE (UPF0421/DUF939 family)